jgi:hypothetical protein
VAEERDPVLERVVRELSPLPKVDPVVTARIVALAMGEKAAARGAVPLARRTPRRFSVAAIGAFAAAAAIVGFVARGLLPAAASRDVAGSAPAASAPVASVPVAMAPTSAANDSAEPRLAASTTTSLAALSGDAPHPIQFVLRAPDAHRVALVGDFNGWDAARGGMRETGAAGVWTATVPLRPGRHVYAYVVDDSVWTLDPRAPRATDPDFGVARSVILVGIQ